MACEIHGIKTNVCYRCRYAKRKQNNPLNEAYKTLKYNARRRNKLFTLTIDEFTQFCKETNYLNKRGIGKNSYHIDRIDESKGYTIDNIQVLTNSENVRKYIQFTHIDEDGNKIFKTYKSGIDNSEEDGECPF